MNCIYPACTSAIHKPTSRFCETHHEITRPLYFKYKQLTEEIMAYEDDFDATKVREVDLDTCFNTWKHRYVKMNKAIDQRHHFMSKFVSETLQDEGHQLFMQLLISKRDTCEKILNQIIDVKIRPTAQKPPTTDDDVDVVDDDAPVTIVTTMSYQQKKKKKQKVWAQIDSFLDQSRLEWTRYNNAIDEVVKRIVLIKSSSMREQTATDLSATLLAYFSCNTFLLSATRDFYSEQKSDEAREEVGILINELGRIRKHLAAVLLCTAKIEASKVIFSQSSSYYYTSGEYFKDMFFFSDLSQIQIQYVLDLLQQKPALQYMKRFPLDVTCENFKLSLPDVEDKETWCCYCQDAKEGDDEEESCPTNWIIMLIHRLSKHGAALKKSVRSESHKIDPCAKFCVCVY